jgi:deoxyadenosine/deoxycytidine kinase
VFFLLSRYGQQRDLLEYDLFVKRVIADYTLEKDALFAEVNLTEAELVIYRQVAALLSKDLPRPDLVVFLTASVEVLIERIKRRDDSLDRNIDVDYLADLVEAYNHRFFHYDATPLLVVKTDQLDFVENSKHLREILDQIAVMRRGTRYYAFGDDLLCK